MRLGTRTRYAMRAMLRLAHHYERGLLSTKEIAEEEQVSAKYLEHLLSDLRRASLIRSVRGAQGGHALRFAPEEITARRIYEVFEGREGLTECVGDEALCERALTCATRELWGRMYAACLGVLEATTLADLVQRSEALTGEACLAAPSGARGAQTTGTTVGGQDGQR
ncbi:MAG: Rrf2 family transcriptional regulator [Anaerolineae bacterium]|nr:Rrf2 family transcriptional regulator [Anaerolineae bacterium]